MAKAINLNIFVSQAAVNDGMDKQVDVILSKGLFSVVDHA